MGWGEGVRGVKIDGGKKDPLVWNSPEKWKPL